VIEVLGEGVIDDAAPVLLFAVPRELIDDPRHAREACVQIGTERLLSESLDRLGDRFLGALRVTRGGEDALQRHVRERDAREPAASPEVSTSFVSSRRKRDDKRARAARAATACCHEEGVPAECGVRGGPRCVEDNRSSDRWALARECDDSRRMQPF